MRADCAAVLRVFREGLESILKDELLGLYVYGALTFPDSQDAVRDIDYHVIVRQALDEGQRESLYRLNGEVVQVAAAHNLELDGYVIALGDTRHTTPPRHQLWPLIRSAASDTSWALHCAHIRAGRVVTVCGPDPRSIYPEPSWPDIAAALYGEIRFVEHALATGNPAYAVLNACRLLYSFQTRDVVISKRGAASWARNQIPTDWHSLIDAAQAAYEPGAAEYSSLSSESARELVGWVWHRIAGLTGNSGNATAAATSG